MGHRGFHSKYLTILYYAFSIFLTRHQVLSLIVAATRGDKITIFTIFLFPCCSNENDITERLKRIIQANASLRQELVETNAAFQCLVWRLILILNMYLLESRSTLNLLLLLLFVYMEADWALDTQKEGGLSTSHWTLLWKAQALTIKVSLCWLIEFYYCNHVWSCWFI